MIIIALSKILISSIVKEIFFIVLQWRLSFREQVTITFIILPIFKVITIEWLNKILALDYLIWKDIRFQFVFKLILIYLFFLFQNTLFYSLYDHVHLAEYEQGNWNDIFWGSCISHRSKDSVELWRLVNQEMTCPFN